MSNKELAKDVIEEILSSSEFQPKKKADLSRFDGLRDLIKKILTKIFEFIFNLLEEIFKKINFFGLGDKINALSETAQLIIYIIAVVLILLLAYLLVKLIIKIIQNTKFKIKKDDISDELEEFTKSPDEPLRLALEYKKKQEYRLAFRYLFLAILIYFNEKECIKIQKFKTNRHYLRELYMSNSELAEKAEPFFNAFYLIWYGKRDIDEESFLKWENSYYDLTNQEEGEVIADKD